MSNNLWIYNKITKNMVKWIATSQTAGHDPADHQKYCSLHWTLAAWLSPSCVWWSSGWRTFFCHIWGYHHILLGLACTVQDLWRGLLQPQSSVHSLQWKLQLGSAKNWQGWNISTKGSQHCQDHVKSCGCECSETLHRQGVPFADHQSQCVPLSSKWCQSHT